MTWVVVIAVIVIALVGLAAGLVARRNAHRLPPSHDDVIVPRETAQSGQRDQRPATKERPPVVSPPIAPDQVADDLGATETIEREAVETAADPSSLDDASVESASAAEPIVEAPARRPRLRDRLSKARALFGGALAEWRLRQRIDDDTWDELEEALIRADVGVATAQHLMSGLREQAKHHDAKTPDDLIELLKGDLIRTLGTADRSLAATPGQLTVWLFVGVNGVGKTTTIGKLAKREVDQGRRVVLAAGDTFRAAAAEQLALWAERAGAELVRGQEGGDPGAVAFDAIASARSRDADLVLVDTAGRLHNKVNLMNELSKVHRVIERSPGELAEVLLVLDATTGQNGLQQARQFCDAANVSGVVLTKLDGTAKGGIVLAIQHELGIPVKLVGVGEQVEDLIEFDPVDFVEALFAPA